MKIRISLLMLFAALFFAGCSNDTNEKQSDNLNNQYLDLPVEFTSMISGEEITMSSTKASGSTWAVNDAIGVFMLKAGQNVATANVVDGADNIKYITASANGSFSASDINQSIFFPESGASVDFVAYYPFNATATSANPNLTIDTKNQANAADFDILYANNSKGQTATGTPTQLSFTHQLSKIVMKMKGVKVDLTGLTATISGMDTKATFNIANGQLTTKSSKVDFAAKVVQAGTNPVLEAVIIPHAGMAGRKITFTTGSGKSFVWYIPTTIDFNKAKNHSFNITLEGDEIIVVPTSGWMEMPSYPVIDDVQLIKHDQLPGRPTNRNYSILYDTKYKMGYWIAYPLHQMHRGGTKRTDKWAYDPSISSNFQPNMKKGVTMGQDYDRGHQMPSSDRTYSAQENWTTFYYTNMTAQKGKKLNQAIWSDLEKKIQGSWVGTGTDTLYMVTGAMLQTATDKTIEYHKDNDGKNFGRPKAYYKVMARKWGGQFYTIGFRMDNRDYSDRDYMACKKTVKEIEDETGFTFFPNLPTNAKTTIDLSKWR